MVQRLPLSIIILTHNEEANLPGCLASLRGLVGRVFIVDSGSADRTLLIAEAAGAAVWSHPFQTYARQRNWAQEALPLQGEWVLHLDADERLTPELVEEINDTLRDPPGGVDGYLLRKRTLFMGRWIRHGAHYPAYHLRLFRRDRGRCEDRLYDQHFMVDGKVRALRHDYLDVLTHDIGRWTIRHARWAELEAQEILTGGSGTGQVRADAHGTPIERRRWLRQHVYLSFPPFARPFLYWFYRYVLRLGFLDGREGFIFHFLQACWYRFLVDVKLLELQANLRIATGDAKERAP